MVRKVKIIIALVLVLLFVDLGPTQPQVTKSFTGKITEIAQGKELDIAKHGVFIIVRLAEYPKISFRMTMEDAEKFGIIEAGGITGVLTPKKAKGMGWKVKMTCDAQKYGDIDNPTYKVISVMRLSD